MAFRRVSVIRKLLYVRRCVRKCAAGLTLLLLMVGSVFGKRKDDVVVMKNGDKFTGEIKSLQYGELIFKSGYMKESVHLDWKEVRTLQSQDTFIVTLSNGERVTGFISKGTSGEQGSEDFKIISSGSALNVVTPDVIVIDQRESSVWNQLTGSISYGFGFASGNNSTN